VYRDIPADLRALVEPVVADHGYELVDAEVQRGRPGMLRITVDSPSGDGRIPVGALADLSREIETQLDAADWMEGSYRLELASPGLDRVLGREKDFAAACATGCEVRIRTRRPQDGRRRFKGVLVGFEEGTVRLQSDGEELEIRFEDIEKANTIYKFTSADFKARANK
jgi:ribosome maturation factor RimP